MSTTAVDAAAADEDEDDEPLADWRTPSGAIDEDDDEDEAVENMTAGDEGCSSTMRSCCDASGTDMSFWKRRISFTPKLTRLLPPRDMRIWRLVACGAWLASSP
jgi:hypothetical protein